MVPPVRPITIARDIPSNKLIHSMYDPNYTGENEAHSMFRKVPKVALMFEFEINEELLCSGYLHGPVKPNYENKPQNVLRLCVSLSYLQHPLLVEYYQWAKRHYASNTAFNYLRNISKMLVPIMKSRERLGLTTSLDDFVFAARAIEVFFERLAEVGVSLDLQDLFCKSIMSYQKFLASKVNKDWIFGRRAAHLDGIRTFILEQAVYIDEQAKEINFYKKKNVIVSPPYSVVTGILRHSLVSEQIQKIRSKFYQRMSLFDESCEEFDFYETGAINQQDYNFLIGYLMSCFVHFNSQRNECAYKLKLKDVLPWEDRMAEVEVYEDKDDLNDAQLIKVLRFRLPKQHRAEQDVTGFFAGYICLDDELFDLLKFYLNVRKFIQPKDEPESAFFLRFFGDNAVSARFYMQAFFSSCNQGHLTPTCNKQDYPVFRLEHIWPPPNMPNFVSSCHKEELQLKPVYSPVTRITRLNEYVGNKCMAVAIGYCKLKRLAEKDTLTHKKEIEAMEQTIKICISSKLIETEVDHDEVPTLVTEDSSQGSTGAPINQIPLKRSASPSRRHIKRVCTNSIDHGLSNSNEDVSSSNSRENQEEVEDNEQIAHLTDEDVQIIFVRQPVKNTIAVVKDVKEEATCSQPVLPTEMTMTSGTINSQPDCPSTSSLAFDPTQSTIQSVCNTQVSTLSISANSKVQFVKKSKRKTGAVLEAEALLVLEDTIRNHKNESSLDVYEEEGKGRGVRSLRDFEKNEFVVEYVGDLLSYANAVRKEKEYAEDASIGCYMFFFFYGGKRRCVDATSESLFKARLINHNKTTPNLRPKVILVDGQIRLGFVAKRKIKKDDILEFDYGDRSKKNIANNSWLAK